MNKLPEFIPKQPVLKPAEDFYLLRRKGIGHIVKMGSRWWTDYNIHDPGITILETLCYAITDLAYRSGWNIKDILAPKTAPADKSRPYPDQAFFTAREILNVNPVTADDFRRLLVDLESVRNAWVFCKECGCDASYYAWCGKDQLNLSYRKPDDFQAEIKRIEPLGLYDVLLELEYDPELGDLNDRKVEHSFVLREKTDGQDVPHELKIELRFPDRGFDKKDDFLKSEAILKIEVTGFGATKGYNLFEESDPKKQDEYLRNYWRDIFYVTFKIQLPSNIFLHINASLRLFGDAFVRSESTFVSLISILEDDTKEGFIQRFQRKEKLKLAATKDAKSELLAHRNLDEDYCRIKVVDTEDVGVCADIELEADADIELVQAQILFNLEQYFNPPILFYSLKELLDAGEQVEEIFDGPELKSGFIRAKELEASSLRRVLRCSDIINLLMDIGGVSAIKNLRLTKYDAVGNIVKGAADPDFHDNKPKFDPTKTGASWLLYISKQHQPRFYQNASRFLFYKKGLPFRPRMDEVRDTLIQLRGEAERPKIKDGENDLPIQSGTNRGLEDYFPVQYSFPVAYGIGPEGLPAHVSDRRRAQAKQLKAYLLVFEQIIGNALSQIANTAELFSLDPKIINTYFVKEFSSTIIKGYDDIVKEELKSALQAMAETVPDFHERRNRFLDHLMARFGEDFGEYASLLAALEGEQVALDKLIERKITFLNAYQIISHDRAKAFDYCRPVPFDYFEKSHKQANQPGIKKRISLLLGFPDIGLSWTKVTDLGGNRFRLEFRLSNKGETVFDGDLSIGASDRNAAKVRGHRAVIKQLSCAGNYNIRKKAGKFDLRLTGKTDEAQGRCLFETKADAISLQEELIAWSASERMIVVEHLLLRPKFPGDALYPACSDGACSTCGDEDPYSFKLTFVIPGWVEPFRTDMQIRHFADRTIRQETPSHLLPKICWIGNDGFKRDPCHPVIGELAELLEAKGVTPEESCNRATDIYAVFSDIFKDWYKDKSLDYFHPDALKAVLESKYRESIGEISFAASIDSALWTGIQALMIKHLHHVALFGFQFDRFENAWLKWLEANADIDWTEEHLQERVEGILMQNLKDPAGADRSNRVCECATSILSRYGTAFYDWINDNFKAGNPLDKFTDFRYPAIELCNREFTGDAEKEIGKLLNEYYRARKEVSCRLWIVVSMLSKLRNTYPAATLHDCDEGSDRNPIQLGKTALGSRWRCSENEPKRKKR